MTIHSLYVFSKTGACLCYREYYRPRNPLRDLPPEEDQKLVFGLLFSLKLLVNRMAPTAVEAAPSGAMFTGSDAGSSSGGGGPSTGPALPPAGPEQGFYRYSCLPGYVLHHLETPTGYRFVLTSDAAAGDLRGALWHIYSELFVGFALKNPLYTVGARVDSVGFVSETDAFLKSLAGYSAK